VGSDGHFGEHAELPKNLGQDERNNALLKPAAKAKKPPARPDKAADRKAAQAYERERQRRERDEAREEAARQKERERRQKAVDKAQAALGKAEAEHAERADALRAEIETIEKKLKAEEADWEEKGKRLSDERGRKEEGRNRGQIVLLRRAVSRPSILRLNTAKRLRGN
jgi:hypothetical protein